MTIEVTSSLVMVGDDLITRWSTDRRGDELLHALTPTDCCRDRLAALLFWNDFSGLEQALAVYRAQSARIDLDVIQDRCKRERQLPKFDLFRERLASRDDS